MLRFRAFKLILLNLRKTSDRAARITFAFNFEPISYISNVFFDIPGAP